MKELLEELGLSPQDFREEVGVSKATYYRWLKNPPKLIIKYLELRLKLNA